MEIISPPTYVFDCRCSCGAHFTADANDIKEVNLLFEDPFWSPNSVTGDNSSLMTVNIIQCPFCGSFKMLDKDVKSVKSYNEILNEDPSKIFLKGVKLYFKNDQERSELLDVEVKKWNDIQILREKYKNGIDLESLND